MCIRIVHRSRTIVHDVELLLGPYICENDGRRHTDRSIDIELASAKQSVVVANCSFELQNTHVYCMRYVEYNMVITLLPKLI